MKKNKFNIQGMTCSSCQAHVQKAVENLNGIKNVNVNLLSNSMIVENVSSVNETQRETADVKTPGYHEIPGVFAGFPLLIKGIAICL